MRRKGSISFTTLIPMLKYKLKILSVPLKTDKFLITSKSSQFQKRISQEQKKTVR